MRSHQVGQREISFTTPEANISRNNNHRTSHRVTPSWWDLHGCSHGNPILTQHKGPMTVGVATGGEGEGEDTYFPCSGFKGARTISMNPASSSKVSLGDRAVTHHVGRCACMCPLTIETIETPAPPAQD